MIRNIFNHMDDISLYGIISILVFFSFFIGMLVWTFALKKNYLTKMGSLPLESSERRENTTDKLQS